MHTTQLQTAYILTIELTKQLLITFEPRLIGKTRTKSTIIHGQTINIQLAVDWDGMQYGSNHRVSVF